MNGNSSGRTRNSAAMDYKTKKALMNSINYLQANINVTQEMLRLLQSRGVFTGEEVSTIEARNLPVFSTEYKLPIYQTSSNYFYININICLMLIPHLHIAQKWHVRTWNPIFILK